MSTNQTDRALQISARHHDRWLTIAEAAAFLRVTVTAATGAVERGDLPVVSGPHGILVDRIALLSLMRRPPRPATLGGIVTPLRFDHVNNQQGKEEAP